jgi:predicted alpha/beta-hydrolase family hydrolase
LRDTWLSVVQSLAAADRLLIGGKSMGGRMASLIADQAEVDGLICLGYPFHPAGKPQTLRVQHLSTLQTPTLIVQGVRDAFGNQAEVANYELSPHIRVHWLTDGDHSFTPRKASGRTKQQNWAEGLEAIVQFVATCPSRHRRDRGAY